MADPLTDARELLAAAPRVLIFTGAGVSAESGVPTFRGPGGLWKTFRPEELATPEAFGRDPRLVWEWYGWRREIVARCAPNPAHLAIGLWMLQREGVTLVTQNVDDLHERGAEEAAGGLVREGHDVPAERATPVRLHGSLFHVRCTGCGTRVAHREPIDATSEATLPHCACGSLQRPDMVWFGEMLPEDALERAFTAARAAGVCLVVGTAGAVHPAAAVVHATAGAGGAVIVVDPGETAYEGLTTLRFRAAAGEVVPQLLAVGA